MDLSDPAVVTAVVVAVVVLLVVVLVLALLRRKKESSRRREHLQERFGPEYDRTVESTGDHRRAEARLSQVEQRRDELRITPLSAASRQRRVAQWQSVQADFVEVPVEAVDSADRLVADVMAERGYPTGDSDERIQLLATDHADTVEHYRTAEAHKARFHSGEGSTEDLRRAFVEYRRLFDVLVEEGADDDASPAPRPDTRPETVTPVRPEDDEPHDLVESSRGASSAHVADGDAHDDRRTQDERAQDDRAQDDRVHDDRVHDDRVVHEDRGARGDDPAHDDRV